MRRYLAEISGRSLSQITRLIRCYRQSGTVKPAAPGRRKPDPRGQPGFLRVDTVHQGDTETRRGLYHINAVDTVTQWQIVGCCETIFEAHLIPVLEAMLHQCPFLVQGFHSDNGSEFINHRVEKLLNKLLVADFTKSRSHRMTDNALVEGKNGAVEVGENGKRRRYRLQDYRTPYEKLLSLDEWQEQ